LYASLGERIRGMRCSVAVLILALLPAGCGGYAIAPPGESAVPASVTRAATQNIYWTLVEPIHYPQVQFTKMPLQESSPPSGIFGNSHNKLLVTSGMRVDSAGRLWIMSYGKDDRNAPVGVFDTPLKQSSGPRYEFVLSGTYAAENIAFDPSGNLWVNSRDNDTVFEYKGPFKKSGTLKPSFKVTAGLKKPLGLAFDAKGDLYVSNFASYGTRSITVFKAPIKNSHPYFLAGLYTPGGLLFDKSGNLYGSTNGPSGSAIVRYDANDLHSGALPSIYDGVGLYHAFGANFVFSASGDLYVSNCGVDASIFVYPTSHKSFSPSLAPTVDYTDYDLYNGCVWGLAIK
jgi:sugar lactone lactonase YvrE